MENHYACYCQSNLLNCCDYNVRNPTRKGKKLSRILRRDVVLDHARSLGSLVQWVRKRSTSFLTASSNCYSPLNSTYNRFSSHASGTVFSYFLFMFAKGLPGSSPGTHSGSLPSLWMLAQNKTLWSLIFMVHHYPKHSTTYFKEKKGFRLYQFVG